MAQHSLNPRLSNVGAQFKPHLPNVTGISEVVSLAASDQHGSIKRCSVYRWTTWSNCHSFVLTRHSDWDRKRSPKISQKHASGGQCCQCVPDAIARFHFRIQSTSQVPEKTYLSRADSRHSNGTHDDICRPRKDCFYNAGKSALAREYQN